MMNFEFWILIDEDQRIHINNKSHCPTAAALTGPFGSLDATLENKSNYLKQNQSNSLWTVGSQLQEEI